MDTATVEQIFAEHWRPGFGSIAPDEVMFVQSYIAEHRPQSFLEVGMASGISAAVIAHLMEEHGGRTVTTIDHDNTFFGDPTKENGFLIDAIYPGGAVTVRKMPFTIALDVPAMGETFQMAFVDANHQHPWPLMDTLCLYPFLDGPKVLLHHDLKLYANQDFPFGIGPKYLYDQIPEANRDRSTANGGNIFALRMTMDREVLERAAADAFRLPWTLRHPLQPKIIDRMREVLAAHYSPAVGEAFEVGLRRYNVAAGPRTS